MSGNIKNAILFVLIIAVAVGAVLLGIKPNIEAKQALDGEIATLQARLAELQAKEADRPIYEAGIVKNKQEFAEIMEEFPNGIEQENYIKFLGDLEADEDIEYFMNSEGFGEITDFYTLGGGGAVAADGTAAPATTDAAATDPAATTEAVATTETAVAADSDSSEPMDNTNVVGISTPISVTFESSYAGIKNMLGYIMTSDDRMTIDTLQVTFDKEVEDEEQQITGSLNLNLYAITSDQRYFAQPDIKDVEIGRDNIFTSDKGNSDVNRNISSKMDDGRSIKSNYDYHVSLNPSSSNNNAVAIGAKGDAASEISTNVNESVNATVKFFMVGVKYYASYNIGNVTYPENFEEGSEFEPGDTLDLLIQSTKRKNDKDLSGVKLVIDNETDMTCNVLVDGDDTENPRVKIVSRIGKVTIHE
ncbi:MAG: hypothetical protein K5656_05995 [Lachnospiraceae bacterium]|nr:hypothetical protein [Lachnospiraceae bacterium]